MNVLFGSPLGALLAKPWVDRAGLFGLRRWYLPLSRLWAAANAAGEDAARFRNEIGAPLPAFWSEPRLRPLLGRNDRVRRAAEAEGLTSLRESALKKVFGGVSTLHEINRVTFVEEVNLNSRG